ncbi:hypothetical protein [Streptomyces pini]|uniref:Uncharacterized protein n=1 Tax=Streptomyces pini TaxID=1520580 RepID=A0A1I4IWG5_9ACTN|nr:hypothetical protein [Streptomyces pini]SFL58610.1 hypothetical protein SAMN05192584_12227 [Streptomyces pini]
MSDTASSPAPAQGGRRPNTTGPAGTVVGAVLLLLAHTVAGYLVFLAYMAGTANPWEPDAAAHSGIAAGLALPVTGVSALLTRGFVRAGRLRRWWYALPVLLGLAALLRLTVLAP